MIKMTENTLPLVELIKDMSKESKDELSNGKGEDDE